MTESKIPPTYEKQFTANRDEAFEALKQARYGGKGLSDPIKTVEVWNPYTAPYFTYR